MVQPLLLEYYNLLPERQTDEAPQVWATRFRRKLLRFKRAIQARYYESTLLRVLHSHNPDVRQAAVLALGLTGSLSCNRALSDRLFDEDPIVRQLASDGLWAVWFRADTKENNEELQRLMHEPLEQVGFDNLLAGYDALIQKAPTFAEALNQRAILHFRVGNFGKSVADCEKVLRLNPFHFGAASGMAQCFMKQKKFRAALRSFRRAHRLNPNLDGVKEAIASLEQILGEEGKR